MPSRVSKKGRKETKQSHSKSQSVSSEATIKEQYNDQLESNLVHFIATNLGTNKEFSKFCIDFADSVVLSLPKKVEYIKGIIALKSHSASRMSLLISHLVKKCRTVERFTTYLHPLYMAHHSQFTEQAMTLFIRNLADKLLTRLTPEEFFNLLNLPSIEGEPLYKSFMKINYAWECYNPIIQTVHCFISKCDPEQLSSALSIVNDFLDECVLNQKHVIVTYEKILTTLNKILRKTTEPEAVFAVLKKCPVPLSAVTILPYIKICIQACDEELRQDDVMALLLPLFEPNNNAIDKLYEQQGFCWYNLIVRGLLPKDFCMSEENKEDVFKYIMEELPADRRREVVLGLIDDKKTPLYKQLCPQARLSTLFTPSLPSAWVKQMKQYIAQNPEATVHNCSPD